jgi:nucleoside-diphosphate-sugar epimerase
MQVKVPLWLLKSLAPLNLMAARTLGYKAMLSPGKVRELRHPDWVCDNAPLSREIGWKPGIGLKEGLRRTLMP